MASFISSYKTAHDIGGIKRLSLIPIALGCLLMFLQVGVVLTNFVLAQSVSLTHGPVVGAVTSNSARVFVRTSSAAEVQIRYSTKPDLSDYQESSVFTTGDQQDFTDRIRLVSLGASTTYYLDVLVNGQSQLAPPYPRFKTFPLPGVASAFKFVVLTDFIRADSDWVPAVSTFRMAGNEQPDFVYIGGDFDHRDPTSLAEKRQMFKDLYTPANNYEDFVFEILRKYAVVHNWDDHDYGFNNADKTYPHKARSLRVLKEYFPVYRVTDYGDWQKFSYGHVDFFLLDSRSQRDPSLDPQSPDKSMLDGDNLGAEGQLKWLAQGLRSSTATWKFILTPVVFNPTNPVPDSWSGYLHERTRIVNFIRRNNIEGVILISGDRHYGAIDNGTNSDFPEMLVPAANLNSCNSDHSGELPTGVWSEGTYGGEIPPPPLCRGYGVVTVLTNPDRVILEVKDSEGNLQVSYTVMLARTPPTARFAVTPTIGYTNTVFTVDASASSDEVDPPSSLRARWDWEDDGVYDTVLTTTKTATHTYPSTGPKTIHLEVWNSAWLTNTMTRTLIVDYTQARSTYRWRSGPIRMIQALVILSSLFANVKTQTGDA